MKTIQSVWSDEVADNIFAIRPRMAYGDLIENLVRDYGMSEVEAKRINILGRVLRGQTRRRACIRLREELNATWDDIKEWDLAWSRCLFRLAWLTMYGEFDSASEAEFDKMCLTNEPKEKVDELGRFINQRVREETEAAKPELTEERLTECAREVLGTAAELPVVIDGNKAKYKKKQVSWEYEKPSLTFHFRPAKLSQAMGFDLTGDAMRYGATKAAQIAFSRVLDFFVQAVDAESTHDSRMEDEFQLGQSLKAKMKETSQEPKYKELIERFRPLYNTPFEIPFDYPGAERIECTSVEPLMEEAGLPVNNRADYEWHWDWFLANVEAVQDMIMDAGYLSSRVSLMDGMDKFRIVIYPMSDQFELMERLRFASPGEVEAWKAIHATTPFRLRACDSEYLEATFTERVDDATPLAQKLVKWSSYLLDYGNETVDKLAADIVRSQRFWFWPEEDF